MKKVLSIVLMFCVVALVAVAHGEEQPPGECELHPCLQLNPQSAVITYPDWRDFTGLADIVVNGEVVAIYAFEDGQGAFKNGEPIEYNGHGIIKQIDDELLQIQLPLFPNLVGVEGGKVNAVQSNCQVDADGVWWCDYHVKISDRNDNEVGAVYLGRFEQTYVCATNVWFDEYCH